MDKSYECVPPLNEQKKAKLWWLSEVGFPNVNPWRWNPVARGWTSPDGIATCERVRSPRDMDRWVVVKECVLPDFEEIQQAEKTHPDNKYIKQYTFPPVNQE